jgi:hypothetical protein
MPSLLFSIFLLLQNVNVKEITGRVSVEPGVQFPSSFTLPLTTATTTSLTIRPQIDGTFRLQLPPGEYRVGTPGRLPPGYSLQSIAYGGVDLLRNPLKIASNDSSELLISLALTGPSPAVSVSGRVMGIAPGDVHRISLREPTGGDLSAALETSVAADGSFTFPKVLPGNYIVYQRLLVQTPITVGNTNVAGLIVARPKDILVAAHVIAEGAQTTPTILLESKGPAGSTQSRGAGSIVLNMGIGENSISVSGIPDGFRLKSITYGDVDLQKQPLKLDGPAVWDIIVRLAPKN